MSQVLVLFDLDGTLVDSAPDLTAAANRLRTRRGLPALPFDAMRTFCGSGARGMLWQALRVAPDAPTYASIRQEFLDDYGEHMHDACALFAGVREMIGLLDAMQAAWGIVTNKSCVFARPICQELGLIPGARCLISGSDIGAMKPKPDALFRGIAECGGDPATTFYVGDDARDAAAARNAGLRFIAAGWGYVGAAAPVGTWGAEAIADCPQEVAKLVAELSGNAT